MKEIVISARDLSVAYGSIEAIENISFDIKKGEFVCIIGPNGGGKTTLINTMLGFLKKSGGKVEILGDSVKKAYSYVGYVPQNALADRNFPITVKQVVNTAFLKKGLHPFKKISDCEKKDAELILKKVGLENYAQRHISQLSGGEYQRLLIARALASKPQILFLDEPTANVDIASQQNIFELLLQLNKEGLTVVMVTHDLSAALKAQKIICVSRELIYCGKPEINDDIKRVMYGIE